MSVSPCSVISILLQHLTDNHFDVLVVDQHALQPVDLLDFVDQIGSEFLDALDRQNVVRRRIAFDDEIALFDDIAILQMDVLALRDQVLAGLLALVHRLRSRCGACSCSRGRSGWCPRFPR